MRGPRHRNPAFVSLQLFLGPGLGAPGVYMQSRPTVRVPVSPQGPSQEQPGNCTSPGAPRVARGSSRPASHLLCQVGHGLAPGRRHPRMALGTSRTLWILLCRGDAFISNSRSHFSQCQALLNRLTSVNPQIEIDGLRNIWIIKPAAKSRGRGESRGCRRVGTASWGSRAHTRDSQAPGGPGPRARASRQPWSSRFMSEVC